MTTSPPTARAVPLRAWRAFGRFRRTRPFWGSLLLLAGAYFVAHPLLGGSIGFLVDIGAAAITPLVLAFGMAAAAVTALLLPAQRHFPAIVATALSVASLPLANLGGFVIGMVCGIVGAGMIFAWAPYTDKQLARFAAKAERKAARKAAKRALRAGGSQPVAG